MKHANNPGQAQNNFSLAVSVNIDEIPLLTHMVEKLAHRRYNTGYSLEPMPYGWKAFDTSGIEAYVSGSIDIRNEGEQISLAYTTCFSFTCSKMAGAKNKLTWINSLS